MVLYFPGTKNSTNFKGPGKKDLIQWNVNTPIQQINMDWKPETDIENLKKRNPSKDQEFLNNYYTQYTRDQIRAFSGDRGQGNFIEPHIYTDITFFAGKEGQNDGTGNTSIFKIKGNPYGADLIRYSSHLLSNRGLLFIGKKFLQQSFNQRAENGIFNPIAVLLSRNNILRFKSQFEYDLSNAGNTDTGKLKEAKGGGKKALDLIKSFAGIDVDTYQDSQNAFIKDNKKSYLQNWGYGVEGQLPTPLFNQVASVVGNAVAKLFGSAKKEDDKNVEATQQEFVVGKRQIAPNTNRVTTPSNAEFTAKSYNAIGNITRGGFTKAKVNDGYSSEIKTGPKKSVYISYGLPDSSDFFGRGNIDKVNAKEIISGDLGENDIYANDARDFIPLYINILNTDETVVLRANLTDLSEDITPNWESIEYIGRPDKQHIYKNTERKISFKVSIIPSNAFEFQTMWRKINKLTALNYPSLSKINTGGDRMVAPFVKLTLGDMIKGQAGYFEQIKANPIDNTPWRLEKGQRLPMYMEVEFTFVYVGDKIPELVNENEMTQGRGKFYDSDLIGSQVEGTQDFQADDGSNLA